MFYYVKIRKQGSAEWKALREEGKILVFRSYDTAKKHAQAIKNAVPDIIFLKEHPMHKESPIYRKSYKKVGW